jgi:uncharacterized protein (DUF1499 family)
MKNATIIKILAILAITAGFGVALWGLIAPLGVWLGIWDFRQGFTLLRNAHAVAPWVAGVTAAVAVGVFILGFKNPQHNLRGLAVFVFVSGALASLSYVIPETFRAPEGENYPPIHDISTDTVNPPDYVAILPLRENAPNTVVYGGSEGMTPESLAQLQQQAYPDIKPWRTKEPKQVVFEKALKAVEQLGWELVAQAPEQGRIEATDTTFWFRFKDDVVITIQEANGETVVNARSLSRVGRGDVGANAKRLRALFKQLEQ